MQRWPLISMVYSGLRSKLFADRCQHLILLLCLSHASRSLPTFEKQSEPLTLHLTLASPERTQLLAEAPLKALAEIDRSEIPLPDPSLTPILIAARWVSHDLYNQDMPGIAADLLEAGYDTPALIRLAGEM